MSALYQKLGSDEEAGCTSSVTEPSSSINIVSVEESQTFSVKIILKEAHLILSNLRDETTVGQLKSEVEKLTNITIPCQRLIFSGRQLKIDSKTMKSINVVGNSSIHLFPIPLDHVVARDLEVGVAAVSATPSLGLTVIPGVHREILERQRRQILSWSFMLVLISAMTVINNLYYLIDLGPNITVLSELDGVVAYTETVRNTAILYLLEDTAAIFIWHFLLLVSCRC